MKKIPKVKPTFDFENELWRQGLSHIAGVDEVGRGCFAGPVVAAAVILPKGFNATDKINDSKQLSPKIRKELASIIQKHAVSFSIAEISVSVINEIGIGKAAQKAFAKAVNTLSLQPEHILIDAFMISELQNMAQTPIVHGDCISISIAAASIIAKVYRDELMEKLHPQYKVYDFSSNKGYGTKKHREAIKKYGFCDLHRTSFDLLKFL
jgi:ribonuclease HII